jgi:hypothetical protein
MPRDDLPPHEYDVQGKPLACPICGNRRFESRRGVMDTRGMTYMNLSWLNRGSTEYICQVCLYVMTFADPQ